MATVTFEQAMGGIADCLEVSSVDQNDSFPDVVTGGPAAADTLAYCLRNKFGLQETDLTGPYVLRNKFGAIARRIVKLSERR